MTKLEQHLVGVLAMFRRTSQVGLEIVEGRRAPHQCVPVLDSSREAICRRLRIKCSFSRRLHDRPRRRQHRQPIYPFVEIARCEDFIEYFDARPAIRQSIAGRGESGIREEVFAVDRFAEVLEVPFGLMMPAK